MTHEEYAKLPGLTQSMMKDLVISPYRMWHRWVNPLREEEEPTPAMQFGTALHALVLEGDEVFMSRYARRASVDDYPGCLVTIADLRAWLVANGKTPKGTRKDEVIAQVLAVDASVPILDVIEKRNAAANEGKVMLTAEDWARASACAESLLREPAIQNILAVGSAEVFISSICEMTGVRLKSRLDWANPDVIFDIKTFSHKKGTIEESIADAMFYQGYIRQAVFYSMVRGWPKTWDGDYVIAFVESEAPHEVRIKVLRPKTGRQPNLYWQMNQIEIRQLIRQYADCLERFGDKPWREDQQAEALIDEDIKQLAYA
jgi:hypothetical protein